MIQRIKRNLTNDSKKSKFLKGFFKEDDNDTNVLQNIEENLVKWVL